MIPYERDFIIDLNVQNGQFEASFEEIKFHLDTFSRLSDYYLGSYMESLLLFDDSYTRIGDSVSLDGGEKA